MINNLFFPPLPIVQSCMGLPDGTGMFVQAARSKGVKLNPSEKTIRKLLINPETVGNSSRLKFRNFVSLMSPSLVDKLPNEDDLPDRLFMTWASIQWRGALIGIRSSIGGDFFPATFDYIESLLDRENLLFKKVVDQESAEAKIRYLLKNDIATMLSSELRGHPQCILEIIKGKSSVEIERALLSNSVWREFMTFSIVSLLMRIIAFAEHEWSRSFKKCIYEYPGQSYLSKLLPTLADSGNIHKPIRKILSRWRELHDFKSWEEMAESLPGASDISDKKRKLMGWCSGEHIPEHGVIEDWLIKLIPDAGDEERYLRYLHYSFFEVAAFMTRLMDYFLKSKEQCKPECLIDAFNTFNRHFAELDDASAKAEASGTNQLD